MLREIIDTNADVAGGGYIREEENDGYITLKRENTTVYSRDDILREIFSCDVTNVRFDESIGTAEDKLFFWQVMKNAKKFSYAPLFKYRYRMRSGSAVHSGITEKTISSLKAERYIWNMSNDENCDIRKVVFENYAISLLGCTRQMIVYDAYKYEAEIKRNQSEIRQFLIKYLFSLKLNLRLIMAVVFLSMSFECCVKLKRIITKDND